MLQHQYNQNVKSSILKHLDEGAPHESATHGFSAFC